MRLNKLLSHTQMTKKTKTETKTETMTKTQFNNILDDILMNQIIKNMKDIDIAKINNTSKNLNNITKEILQEKKDNAG